MVLGPYCAKNLEIAVANTRTFATLPFGGESQVQVLLGRKALRRQVRYISQVDALVLRLQAVNRLYAAAAQP